MWFLVPHQEEAMKLMIFITLIFFQSAFSCELKEIRKEVFGHFAKDIPFEGPPGKRSATTVLKEFYLTDTMMRLRGENFFITRMVFDIVRDNGLREEKEMLLAAVVDLASCKVESYESGDILGSSLSIKP